MAISAATFTATYSPAGAALAKQGRHSYEVSTQWNDADSFVGSAMRSIVNDPNTTADEKEIARMGFNMGNQTGLQFQNSAQARYAAAGAIAGAIPGSLGAVMGTVLGNAFAPANRWDDADKIMSQGLQSVRDSAKASQDEKDVANLGLAMGNHAGMQFENSARARKQAADALVSAPSADTGALLGIVTQRAFGAANRWDDADKIAGDGLQAIMTNPRSNPTQQSLARAILDQTNVNGIQWEDSARARASALTQIVGTTEVPAPPETPKQSTRGSKTADELTASFTVDPNKTGPTDKTPA